MIESVSIERADALKKSVTTAAEQVAIAESVGFLEDEVIGADPIAILIDALIEHAGFLNGRRIDIVSVDDETPNIIRYVDETEKVIEELTLPSGVQETLTAALIDFYRYTLTPGNPFSFTTISSSEDTAHIATIAFPGDGNGLALEFLKMQNYCYALRDCITS